MLLNIETDCGNFIATSWMESEMGNEEFHREVYSLESFFRDPRYSGGIRIPAIQREYVQGREDDKGKEIRSNFIPKLVDAVFGIKKEDAETGAFALDFIYGVRDENTQAFLVLDGQQRLTTLFLVAWVCGLIAGKDWQFDYESRRAAQMFLRGLITHKCVWGKGIRDQIIDSNWFLPIWEKDITVAGMMNVLVTIEQNVKRICGKDVGRVKQANFENVKFAVEDIPDDEPGFNRIFLKMNSRGRQLTSWENMKSVLDQYVPDNLKDAWRADIEGWAEFLWAQEGNDIDRLDQSMENTVRLAYCRMKDMSAGCQENGFVMPTPGHFSDQLYEIEMRLENSDKHELTDFYSVTRKYFESLCKGYLPSAWTETRSENCLWEGTCSSHDFWETLSSPGGCADYSSQLRFAFLAEACSQQCDMRKVRVILNLLDWTIDLDRGYARMLSDGIRYLRDSTSASDLEMLSSFNAMQLNDERRKIVLDGRAVVELEKDALSWHGSLSFLSWSPFADERDVAQRMTMLHRKIEDDWIEFYCDLLNNLEYDQDDPERRKLKVESIVPLTVGDWGEFVFSRNHFIQSIAKYLQNPAKNIFPFWVRHLKTLLETNMVGGNLRKIKFNRGWMFVQTRGRIAEYAIRLDWSEEEYVNRGKLKKNLIRYSDKYLESKESDVYFDVWQKDWWTSTNPRRLSKNDIEIS